MAVIAFHWRNDLHWLHHNVRGVNFEEIHEKFGEYYDKALDDVDFFAERALMKEIDVMPNLSTVESSEWNIIDSDDETSVEEAFEMFIENGNDYLEALDLCRDYCEKEGYNDICSDIDTIHGFWALEIEYKAPKVE